MLRNFFPVPFFEAPTDPAAAPLGDKPWFDGKLTAPEEIGYFQRRGWDKDPVQAAIEAGKAHREAEKALGAPASELLRLPKEANDPKWADIHARLGKPKEAKEYGLADLKSEDGKPLFEADAADRWAAVAFDMNLPKDRVPEFAKSVLKIERDRADAARTATAAKLAEEKAALDKNWGANKEANLFVARQAAAALGVTPEQINALENATGYATVMEMLRQIGMKTGEDKFIRNDLKPAGGAMTKSEAVAKMSELRNDKDFTNRLMNGGVKESQEWEALQKLVAGA